MEFEFSNQYSWLPKTDLKTAEDVGHLHVDCETQRTDVRQVQQLEKPLHVGPRLQSSRCEGQYETGA